MKRDYIYKFKNTDLEIGVSGVLLRILFYFEARKLFQTDWLSVCVTQQPLEYNDPKDITQRSWYINNNEVKRLK